MVAVDGMSNVPHTVAGSGSFTFTAQTSLNKAEIAVGCPDPL